MKVVLIYYSKTGQMESITKQIADNYQKKNIDVKVYSMETYLQLDESIDFLKEDTLFGFGFPYHEYIPPKSVDAFFSLIKNYYTRIPVFLYTSGSNHQSDRNQTVIRRLAEKNYYSIGNFELLCPNSRLNENSEADIQVFNDEQIETFVNRTMTLFDEFKKNPFIIREGSHRLKEILKGPVHYIRQEIYYTKLRQGSTCMQCGKCIAEEKQLCEKEL